jgi:hypothetical protein
LRRLLVGAGYTSGGIDETEALLDASVQWKNEDEFDGAGTGLVKTVGSASTGSFSQINPVGGAVTGSCESCGIDQCFQ